MKINYSQVAYSLLLLNFSKIKNPTAQCLFKYDYSSWSRIYLTEVTITTMLLQLRSFTVILFYLI